jgi:hypothetical protein
VKPDLRVTAPKRPTPMSCVWYGRAMFCAYLPERLATRGYDVDVAPSRPAPEGESRIPGR